MVDGNLVRIGTILVRDGYIAGAKIDKGHFSHKRERVAGLSEDVDLLRRTSAVCLSAESDVNECARYQLGGFDGFFPISNNRVGVDLHFEWLSRERVTNSQFPCTWVKGRNLAIGFTWRRLRINADCLCEDLAIYQSSVCIDSRTRSNLASGNRGFVAQNLRAHVKAEMYVSATKCPQHDPVSDRVQLHHRSPNQADSSFRQRREVGSVVITNPWRSTGLRALDRRCGDLSPRTR